MLSRALILFFFLAMTLPLAFQRVAGGRSAERQGYTAGIIRIYCQEPGHSVVKGPQIHFGKNPFNLEFTGFEWVQGLLARAVGGAECEAVEPVGKIVSILFSALGVLAVALLAAHLWGPVAGLLGAFILGTDELWLRYSTYTMIENRVLTLSVLAILFSLKRRPFAAAILWALTFTQKPQIFLFATAFWGTTELVLARGRLRPLLRDQALKKVAAAFAAAVAVGFAWFTWSKHMGEQSDLPWIIHTGPRITNWYMGGWEQRISLEYARQLLLGWLKESGVNVGVPVAILLGMAATKADDFRKTYGRAKIFANVIEVLKAGAPLLAAMFFYTFIFYPVFIVHEYYALPLNVGRAITTAGVLGIVLRFAMSAPVTTWALRIRNVILIIVFFVVGRFGFIGTRTYADWALHINDPARWYYHPGWDAQIFPKKHSMVVVAIPGTGRDLLYLYLTKQRGFVWCSTNQKFAPRKYWKEHGIEYVAWTDGGVDPKTRRHVWTVRTIDEELAYARARGWSSDVNDVWAGRTMAEWAALASRSGHDPCVDAPDPRKW